MKDFGRVQRTETLIESVGSEIRLTDENARDLQNLGRELASEKTWWGDDGSQSENRISARTIIRCSPESGKDLWKVTIVDAIGAVSIPGVDFIIGPKIPMPHFIHIVRNAFYEPRTKSNQISLENQDSFLNLVAEWFISSLETALASGLAKDYKLMEDNSLHIRGRINIKNSLTNWQHGKISLYSEYEEFNNDTQCNRVLLFAAKIVVSNSKINESLRARASRSIIRMSEVGDFQPSDLRVDIRNLWPQYRPTLKLAKQIILGHGRALTFGTTRSQSFLVRTPELIEEGIRETLTRRLQNIGKVERRRTSLKVRPSSLTFSPDLLISLGKLSGKTSPSSPIGGSKVTGDVKYQINKGEWIRSNLYQAVTFATAFGAVGGLVVTFGEDIPSLQQNIEIGTARFSQINWPILESFSPEQSEDSVILRIEEWLVSLLAYSLYSESIHYEKK